MRQYFRAYNARSSRQQGADRLVYNETDLRTVLWQAVDPSYEGERPSTIRLAADIYLTKPIELGAYQYNVTIEGSGRFAIAEGGTFSGSYLFGLPDGNISDIDFIGVTLSISSVGLMFGGSSLTVVEDFIFEECAVEVGVPSSMFASGISISSTRLDLDNLPVSPTMVLQAPGAGTFSGVFSHGNILSHIYQDRIVLDVGNIGVGCGGGALLSLDVDGGVRVRNELLTLKNADPLITPGDRTFITIIIDNTAPDNATGTIQIAAGKTGQLLILHFLNASSSVVLDNTATVNVNKNNHAKKPTTDETVTFIYSNGKWQELCRSENT